MPKHITRRKALAAGVSTTALVTAASDVRSVERMEKKLSNHPPFLSPWSPPENLQRDLTPGITPVRLASWSTPTTLDYKRDKGVSITEMVKRVRKHGYSSAGSSIYNSSWKNATESEIRELNEALEQYDVTFFDMHTVGTNIHPDPVERKKVNRVTIESCEVAERLKCVPMVTTHTGTAGAGRAFKYDKNNWTWETWKKSVNVMKMILKETAGMKVELGIEPSAMTAVNGPVPLVHLIEEVADPRLKICLDPVNMMNLSRYGQTTELLEECFDLLGDNIIAAHAKDSLISEQQTVYITEVAAGKGVLDYETYLVRLSRLSQPITLLIEHIEDEDYPAAKKFLEDTAANVSVKIYQ